MVDVHIGSRTLEHSKSVSNTLSGSLADNTPIISTNNFMIVRFSADRSVVGKGFTAEWTTG